MCTEYHIPIANARGWGSVLQRAEYARRFKEAEDRGLKCVLLYCGDHDPDGLRISEFLRNNLIDLIDVTWSDGEIGYDPVDLEINRFGLNYDFIIEHNLTWIDNLITGSKKNLADPNHKNYHMPYVQEYLYKVGKRKCEANSIVIIPDIAAELMENTIISYLGHDALERFDNKRRDLMTYFDKFLTETDIDQKIADIIKTAERY